MTASADKLVKVWDVKDNIPKFVKEIDPKVGTILSLSANPDYPFVFAVSGDNVAENIKVLDISTFKAGKFLFAILCFYNFSFVLFVQFVTISVAACSFVQFTFLRQMAIPYSNNDFFCNLYQN